MKLIMEYLTTIYWPYVLMPTDLGRPVVALHVGRPGESLSLSDPNAGIGVSRI